MTDNVVRLAFDRNAKIRQERRDLRSALKAAAHEVGSDRGLAGYMLIAWDGNHRMVHCETRELMSLPKIPTNLHPTFAAECLRETHARVMAISDRAQELAPEYTPDPEPDRPL